MCKNKKKNDIDYDRFLNELKISCRTLHTTCHVIQNLTESILHEIGEDTLEEELKNNKAD